MAKSRDLVSYYIGPSNLKMEATYSPKQSEDFHPAAWRYIIEERTRLFKIWFTAQFKLPLSFLYDATESLRIMNCGESIRRDLFQGTVLDSD
jgi:hypothetical protein